MKSSIVFLLSICFALGSCTQEPINIEEYQSQLFNNLDKNSKNTKVGYTFANKSSIPYQLYINDILAVDYSESNFPNRAPEYVWTNLEIYILGNGTYNAKLKLFPGGEKVKVHPDGLIHRYDFNNLSLAILRYEVDENGNKENSSGYKEFRFELKKDTTYIEFEMEFTISDLPYSKLRGWTESQDLRKIDREVLKKEVVAYYTYLREVLNTGQNNKFTYELQKTKGLEIATKVYMNKEEYQTNMLSANASIITKDLMLPIEHYKMAIEGNGKLVRLYRTDTEHLNWNVLIYDDGEYSEPLGVRLHKPKGSDTFEIITK